MQQQLTGPTATLWNAFRATRPRTAKKQYLCWILSRACQQCKYLGGDVSVDNTGTARASCNTNCTVDLQQEPSAGTYLQALAALDPAVLLSP